MEHRVTDSEGVRIFQLGDVALQSGETLRDARLAYATHGELSAAGDNAVLFPTYYGGTHRDNARLVGAGRALDPARWFIVIPNLFGNGVSSSPSNHAPQPAERFPRVTIFDNVMCQEQLLGALGVRSLRLAMGWSMGAQQAFHHAALFPDRVRSLLAICGSARTSPHNFVFLEGVKAALLADPDFDAGRYRMPPRRGLAAFGRVYAGWAYSQAFFRDRLHEKLGHDSVEALLRAWEADHLVCDANDLLCVLASWQASDISRNAVFGGDFERALAAVTARAIVMPSSTDLYFPVEDSRREVSGMPSAELRVLESDFGHVAGGPDRHAPDTAFIEAAIRELLDSS